MKCENCSYYSSRPITPQESNYLKMHPNTFIDTRFCTLGGCDGSRFLDKDRDKNTQVSK